MWLEWFRSMVEFCDFCTQWEQLRITGRRLSAGNYYSTIIPPIELVANRKKTWCAQLAGSGAPLPWLDQWRWGKHSTRKRICFYFVQHSCQLGRWCVFLSEVCTGLDNDGRTRAQHSRRVCLCRPPQRLIPRRKVSTYSSEDLPQRYRTFALWVEPKSVYINYAFRIYDLFGNFVRYYTLKYKEFLWSVLWGIILSCAKS